jgi:hypothetical protein
MFTFVSLGSPEVTALEGQELYLHFFHEQLRSAQLGEYAAQEEARSVALFSLTSYYCLFVKVSGYNYQ